MAAQAKELDQVRNEVRNILGKSAAWQTLSTNERRDFAQNMVKVAHYLAKDPGWLDTPMDTSELADTQGLAEALGPVEDIKKRLAEKPGQVGAEFQAGALREGTQTFRQLVTAVDFPEFVSSLIQGVFQAIVDASIQQMEAYGELLAATAKTVDQFAQDHFSDDQAREHIANRFPSLLRIERSSEGSRLQPREGVEDTSALQQVTHSTETIDFEDQEAEMKFVQAVKLEMARQRQKLMALMVLLGINRIIVTNGRINAKVIFDIEASDVAARQASAGLTAESETQAGAAAAAWSPWGAGGAYARHRSKTTVRSAIDDTSESKAQMKAQLSGDVRVNFRSETLPPERMLDALQFDQLNYLSQAVGQPPQQTGTTAQGGAAQTGGTR